MCSRLEAAEHEKKTEEAKDGKAESEIGSSRSRSVQGRRDWQPSITGIAAWLHAHD